MPNLVELIQEIVKNTNNACALSDVLFGTVVSISPLKIQVEQKLTLSEEFLILTKNVKDYTVDVTVDWNTDKKTLDANHNHSLGGNISVNSSGSVDGKSVSITNTVDNSLDVETKNIDLSHTHPITGRKKITIHNALKSGEKVILIQQMGGQKFIVLDKV